jgi:hypothetical protein
MTDPISVPTTMQKADLYSQKTIDRPTAKKEHPFHSIQKFKNDPNPDQSNTIVFQERDPIHWDGKSQNAEEPEIIFCSIIRVLLPYIYHLLIP